MNKCLNQPCDRGFAFYKGFPFQLDHSGAFRYVYTYITSKAYRFFVVYTGKYIKTMQTMTKYFNHSIHVLIYCLQLLFCRMSSPSHGTHIPILVTQCLLGSNSGNGLKSSRDESIARARMGFLFFSFLARFECCP